MPHEYLTKGEPEKLIWGNRLYNEQTGMLTLLEFLCVYSGMCRSEKKFEDPFHRPNSQGETASGKIHLSSYRIPKRPILRSLVFNDPYLNDIYTDESDPWQTWYDKFNADEETKQLSNVEGEGLLDNTKLMKIRDAFSYSEKSPQKSFEAFRKMIELLRSSGINVPTKKRWTSHFVFPWGRNCLFTDLNQKGKTDRRFFARNGEMLFLMLSFAEKRSELSKHIWEKIYESGHLLDDVCRFLVLEQDDFCNVDGWNCYLPEDFVEKDLPRVNMLCEDMIALFMLPIPTPDIINFVQRIIELHLLCYFLERGYRTIRENSGVQLYAVKPVFLCEVIQRDTSAVRRVSHWSYEQNEELSTTAVQCFYRAKTNVVIERDALGDDDEAYDDEADDDTEDNKPATEKEVIATHKQHWVKIHRDFAKDCGLASKFFTNAYRYAPSDELLETLVATLVPEKRLSYADFLSKAYDRYGLVFASDEFQKTGIEQGDYKLDASDLNKNKERLKRRLASLGLLESLSDGCDFIVTPYKA